MKSPIINRVVSKVSESCRVSMIGTTSIFLDQNDATPDLLFAAIPLRVPLQAEGKDFHQNGILRYKSGRSDTRMGLLGVLFQRKRTNCAVGKHLRQSKKKQIYQHLQRGCQLLPNKMAKSHPVTEPFGTPLKWIEAGKSKCLLQLLRQDLPMESYWLAGGRGKEPNGIGCSRGS